MEEFSSEEEAEFEEALAMWQDDPEAALDKLRELGIEIVPLDLPGMSDMVEWNTDDEVLGDEDMIEVFRPFIKETFPDEDPDDLTDEEILELITKVSAMLGMDPNTVIKSVRDDDAAIKSREELAARYAKADENDLVSKIEGIRGIDLSMFEEGATESKPATNVFQIDSRPQTEPTVHDSLVEESLRLLDDMLSNELDPNQMARIVYLRQLVLGMKNAG